jgi:hypothetical protein
VQQQIAQTVSTGEFFKQKYSRFVCPECKGSEGYFKTFTFRDSMASSEEFAGKGYKDGDQIGACASSHRIYHDRTNGCGYEWVRTDESDVEHFVEEEVLYPVTFL